MKNTMLNISVDPSRPATTGQSAKRMGPAPLSPTQEAKALALNDRPLKGARHRNTLSGLATNIMNRPIISAGHAMEENCDGLARRPSIKNMSSCISQVMPSKNLRTSLFMGISALLPMTMAAMYNASRPFPNSSDAMPLAKKPMLRTITEYKALLGSLTLSRTHFAPNPTPSPTRKPTTICTSSTQAPVPSMAMDPVCFVELRTCTRMIVSTYAIGSLLPDSSSNIGLRFSLRCILLPRSTENTDAESVEDMTAESRKQPRNDAPSGPIHFPATK